MGPIMIAHSFPTPALEWLLIQLLTHLKGDHVSAFVFPQALIMEHASMIELSYSVPPVLSKDAPIVPISTNGIP